MTNDRGSATATGTIADRPNDADCKTAVCAIWVRTGAALDALNAPQGAAILGPAALPRPLRAFPHRRASWLRALSRWVQERARG
jgi:hypothetical protein